MWKRWATSGAVANQMAADVSHKRQAAPPSRLAQRMGHGLLRAMSRSSGSAGGCGSSKGLQVASAATARNESWAPV